MTTPTGRRKGQLMRDFLTPEQFALLTSHTDRTESMIRGLWRDKIPPQIRPQILEHAKEVMVRAKDQQQDAAFIIAMLAVYGFHKLEFSGD